MAQLNQLLSAALAHNTQKTYTAGTQRYLQFCHRYSLGPVPAHKHTMAFLASSLSRYLAPNTVQVYLAAVGTLHRQLGLRDPTRHNPTLQLVLRGFKRTAALAPRRSSRLPLTSRLLRHLLPEVQSTRTLDPHD